MIRIYQYLQISTVLRLVTQLCPTLCDPMDCSLTGSSAQGILQARILEWVAIPSSRGSSRPKDRTQVSHIAGHFLLSELQGSPQISTDISFLLFHLDYMEWNAEIAKYYKAYTINNHAQFGPRHLQNISEQYSVY